MILPAVHCPSRLLRCSTPAGAHAAKPREVSLFRLKQRFGETRLADDALDCAAPQGVVQRHRHGDGRPFTLELHDAMASALAHRYKSVPLKYLADFGAGEDPQPTQQEP